MVQLTHWAVRTSHVVPAGHCTMSKPLPAALQSRRAVVPEQNCGAPGVQEVVLQMPASHVPGLPLKVQAPLLMFVVVQPN